MVDLFFTILVFFGVIVITAVIFGGWLIVSVFRFVGWMIGAIVRPTATPGRSMPLLSRRCAGDNCRAENPMSARFCRRCGRALAEAQQVRVRRVAMW